MASVNVSTGGLDSLMASVRKQVESKWADLAEANQESARFGAQTARSYTASRPGAKSGKGGRVASGKMINALRWRLTSIGPDLIRSQYGFVDDYELYFRAQTVTGFTHNRSGEYIAPTFALRDSIGPTQEYARGAAGRAA